MQQKRLLSGIKPTGDLHIGNYLGAMKQFVDLQNDYECYLFIADYHALNQIHDPQKLAQYTMEIAKAYLAIGLNPEKTVLFRQSDIPPHTELCWIFNSITQMALLKRAHAYKDAIAKKIDVSMGLFDYPVLMAADILLYDTDVVPVGQDQKQHLEMTNEIARVFNNLYGQTFKLPEEFISTEVAVIKGLDGRKMSKSYNNVIGLFDTEDVTRKKVLSIKTDSKRPEDPKDPEECNIFSLHKLFSKSQLAKIADRYRTGQLSYKESKEILAENINNFLKEIREKKQKLDNDPSYVLSIFNDGKNKALAVAQKKLAEIRKKIGISA